MNILCMILDEPVIVWPPSVAFILAPAILTQVTTLAMAGMAVLSAYGIFGKRFRKH
jgi:hypothetical protein